MASCPNSQWQPITFVHGVADGAVGIDSVQADTLLFVSYIKRSTLMQFFHDLSKYLRNKFRRPKVPLIQGTKNSTFEPRRYEPSSERIR